MLSEAFAFPRQREGAVRDLLVGGALVLTSFLLFPALVLYGYLLRVMDAGARDRSMPPAFGDWGGLLVDGLRSLVVLFVYGLLPTALVVGPPAGLWVALGMDGLQSLSQAAVALLAVMVAMLWLLALVLLVHLPAAMVALATQGRLRAAFQFDALWAVVSTRQYLVGVFVAGLVYVLGSLATTLLTPLLVGFVLLFYVQVVVAYLLGRSVGGAAVTAIRPVE